MTSPKKAKTVAPVVSTVDTFVLACEAFGMAQGSARATVDKSEATFMPILIEHVKGAPKEAGMALEDFKRDIRAHIIAPYMTARGFAVSFDDVRPMFDQGDKKAACKAAAVGAHLSKANDPATIELWQDAYAKGDGLARVRNTEAFNALGLDIKTGVKKVPVAATSNATNAGQGKPETTATTATTATVKDVVSTAPADDLALALSKLPASTFASILAKAARMSYSNGLNAIDVHFADAIIAASLVREKEAAEPATPCKAA